MISSQKERGSIVTKQMFTNTSMARPNTDHAHLYALRQFYREYKYIPTVREAGELLGFSSPASATFLYRRLIDQGFLIKQGQSFIPRAPFLDQKIYDSVRAGFPSPATEEQAHDIDLESFLLPHPTTMIMVTVQGDSMIDAGIYEGDIAIIDKGKQAVVDDIVVAEVDGDYTLKFLNKDPKRGYFLKPGNKAYPDIYADDELKIFGVLTGVIRKYS